MPLRTALCERLGITVPVIQAPIGDAATPVLAAAVCEAGALGMLTMSNADGAQIRTRIAEMRERTSRPFGVNLLLETEQRAQLAACLDADVSIVSLAWRRLDAGDAYVEEAHAAGALVMLTVGSAAEARHAVDAGIDIVVAQGVEAGGHVWGSVGTLPLVPAVVDAVSPTPVVAAGGVGDGRGVAAVLALGAQAAWIGTRFLLAAESPVHPLHAELAMAASEADTVLSTIFDVGWPGAPHRTLVNSTVRAWLEAGSPPPGERPGEGEVIGRSRDGRPVERYFVDHPTTDRLAHGDAEPMALYAGQSVGVIHERKPAATIVHDLMREAEAALAGLGGEEARTA